MAQSDLDNTSLVLSMRAARASRPGRGDPLIDDYLIQLLANSWLGFGF